MAIRVDIKGLGKVNRYILDLEKNLNTRISNTNEVFMKAVKKGAKMRAPVDTGALRQSIILEPVRSGKNVKIWKITAGNNRGAKHAFFQEEGFTPHMAPIFNSVKLTPGVYMVSKNTPFIKPALEAQLGIFAQKLDASATQALTTGGK